MNANAPKKPVVVAVSADQPTVVEYAAGEARRRGAELVVLHVCGTVLQDVGAVAAISASPQDDADATAVLDQAKRVIDGLVDAPPTRYTSELGSVIKTIEDHAAKAQLLVVGADEINWFERVLGGAIARHIAEHAACPVIVVPPVHDLSALYGGVCVAVDDDAQAAGPLRFAFEEASARESTLVVLHVVPEGVDHDEMEASRVGVAEVLAGWHEEFPDVAVTTRVVSEDEVVTAAARMSEQSELLVVGRPRRGFLSGRAAAPRLTREAHCPLAVVDGDYGVRRNAGVVDAMRDVTSHEDAR
ncbi:MAG: universal stress protein [Actinomycetota bacterium]|nr:universal stress protein [Actinomycetota bacterium]